MKEIVYLVNKWKLFHALNILTYFPGHRYRPCYEFGYVVLDLLFTIPEDSGVYSIVATNAYGEVTTSAEVICDSK